MQKKVVVVVTIASEKKKISWWFLLEIVENSFFFAFKLGVFILWVEPGRMGGGFSSSLRTQGCSDLESSQKAIGISETNRKSSKSVLKSRRIEAHCGSRRKTVALLRPVTINCRVAFPIFHYFLDSQCFQNGDIL